MANIYNGITVEAFLRTEDGQLLDVDKDLTPEQKTRLATELSVGILNTAYAGTATFFPANNPPVGK